MLDYFIFPTLGSSCDHRYTVASIGCNMKDRQFSSRQEAKNYMYDYIDRKGFQVREKWHDGHYVTYVCDNGVKFFINRVC